MGDRFIQGKWSRPERRGGINWKELWVLNKVLEAWGQHVAGKLVLVRMDNAAAASYANYGAGRAPTLALLARKIKGREVVLGCTIAAFHIAGRGDAAADALPRFSIRVRGPDLYPEREIRRRYRKEVEARCGAADVDMMAGDDGRNAWAPNFRSPSNSALEGPLPRGRLWRFPRIEMVELVLARIA